MAFQKYQAGRSLAFKDTLQETFDDYSLYVGSSRSNFYSGARTDMNLAFGRASGDFLKGGAKTDDLMGGGGKDALFGGGGADHLDGGEGDDALFGGKMMDNLRGGKGNDFLSEGEGHGDLDGGIGNDTLIGGKGADAFVIALDSGHDVILDFRAGRGMFDHLAINDLEPEDLRFQDTGKGLLISWNDNQGSVLLVGIEKSDLAQDDFMFADDRYLIQPASRSADRVSAISFEKNEGAALSAPAAPGNSLAQPYNFDDFNLQRGQVGADVMLGTVQRDVYLGLGGDDRLFGGGNDDHLAGDAGNDVLDGGDGMDDLKGGVGADSVYGGAMADNLMGEDGNDFLYGGGGHDMLEGGKGNDQLNGGDGADAFIVMPDSGNDVVTGGFDAGPGAFDHIAFVDILPNQVKVSDTASGAIVSWQTAAGSGSILLLGVAVSQLSQDDFMFSNVEGGGFIDNPLISSWGNDYLFL